MPITKTILKKVRQQAVIQLVGDGTANIDLNADLCLADETFKGYANANVNINAVTFSTNETAPIIISRGGANVLILYGNDNWYFAQNQGFVLTQNNTSNITVTIPSATGTVILGLTKAAGYAEPDRQNLQPRDR